MTGCPKFHHLLKFSIFLGIASVVAGALTYFALLSRDGTPELEYVIFSEKTHTLRCIDRQGIEKFANLEEAMRHNSCVAGSNGGFFNKHDKPVGLLIDNGIITGTMERKSPITSATIFTENGGIKIVDSQLFKQRNSPPPPNALQIGPFLVKNGQMVEGNRNPLSARRTFIATDGNGQWLLGYAQDATLTELAKTLAKANTIPDFRIQTAVNLDGGESSALWIQNTERQLYIREMTTVANYLGIQPK